MPVGRFNARLLRKSQAGDYALALCLAAACVAGRLLLDKLAARGEPFLLLFPATVLAGVLCGTGPAAAAALAGFVAVAWMDYGRALLAWPPFNQAQIDSLLFVPASFTMLWATGALRRAATKAASAELRLAEVFRQFPGNASILEAPDGRVLLRSDKSNDVLGHPQRAFSSSAELTLYGGLHADGSRFEPDDYPIVRALKAGEVVRGEVIRYQRGDGRVIQLEIHAGPIRDAEGAIVASVGMAFDISDRVAAECRLIESEARHRAAAERLRAAIDSGALGLWEFDMPTARLRIDAAMAAMLGLPPEPVEMPRTDFHQLIHPDDRGRAAEMFNRAREAGGSYADEYCVLTRQGETRWIVSRGAVLADLHMAVGVVSDVTDRRRREEALQAALQARDVLMHEADHRIKNSLQMVVSLLRLQIARVPDQDAKQALLQAIARVDAIANAHHALQNSPDLRGIHVDTMLTELCSHVGSLNPSLELRCDARTRLTLGSEAAIPLGLVASEALTNALRHAYAPGEPGVVTLSARIDTGALVVVIEDSGAGLPEKPGRSGLGTTVMTMLSRQIGAAMTRESAAGQGTVVTLRLAVAGVEAKEEVLF